MDLLEVLVAAEGEPECHNKCRDTRSDVDNEPSREIYDSILGCPPIRVEDPVGQGAIN